MVSMVNSLRRVSWNEPSGLQVPWGSLRAWSLVGVGWGSGSGGDPGTPGSKWPEKNGLICISEPPTSKDWLYLEG